MKLTLLSLFIGTTPTCCRFKETYPDNNATSALPFAMNSEFSGTLAKEMVILLYIVLKVLDVCIVMIVKRACARTHTLSHRNTTQTQH